MRANADRFDRSVVQVLKTGRPNLARKRNCRVLVRARLFRLAGNVFKSGKQCQTCANLASNEIYQSLIQAIMSKTTLLPAGLNGLMVLRFALAIIFISHAIARIQLGTVANFGDFLNTQGFRPIGFYLAWGVTIYELIGGALLLGGRYLKWVCLLFILHQIGGITLVHFKQGWFVVGSGQGGCEYSFLLIASLLAIAFPAGFRRFG